MAERHIQNLQKRLVVSKLTNPFLWICAWLNCYNINGWSKNMADKFEQQLADLDIKLTKRQKMQFYRYYEMLTEWNKVMNLTGITEYDQVNEKHFVDSLSVTKAVDIRKYHSLIDIGTGAGFPGIPLKIVYPHLQVILLDSLQKRIKFLDVVIEELGLENIKTLHGRAEDYAKKPEYREQFDICVSRAVANISTLSEYCIPYIKVSGMFISYKSEEIDEEAKKAEKAVKLLGGEIEEIIKFQLPGTEIGRSFVKIRKKEQTKKKYPRKAGLPAKEPLR